MSRGSFQGSQENFCDEDTPKNTWERRGLSLLKCHCNGLNRLFLYPKVQFKLKIYCVFLNKIPVRIRQTMSRRAEVPRYRYLRSRLLPSVGRRHDGNPDPRVLEYRVTVCPKVISSSKIRRVVGQRDCAPCHSGARGDLCVSV